ncbi:MAG: hypothetical protein JXM69_00765 [Anaerolineae bacterium]|nr:hypothetical protein [Anaerolineae bacterium]
MSRALLQSSQVAVTLSLNIITEDKDAYHLAVIPLLRLSPLGLMVLYFTVMENPITRYISRVTAKITRFIRDTARALSITGKMLTIGVNSLAWGVLL